MNFEMEDILMTDTDLLIQNLRRENEALGAAYHEIAEDLVAFGRVDYWLCDEVPTKLHLKYQPQNDGNYENKPCVECVKEYYFSKNHPKEVNDAESVD